MKRTFKIVIIIVILIGGFGCNGIEHKPKELYTSIEAYLSTVDYPVLESKEMGNLVVLITESETSNLTEHILLADDRKESLTLVHNETIEIGQTAISIIERTVNFLKEDSVNYIVFAINDKYLIEKGGAIYLNNKSSDNLEYVTSLIIKPHIIQMDKSRVYIMENRYTKKLSQEEELYKDFESASKIISCSDSFEMLEVESISITDTGGTLLYHYLFDN